MPAPPKRSIIAICATSALFFLLFLSFGSHPSTRAPSISLSSKNVESGSPEIPNLNGHAIAGKIGNETKKAELGNHAWYLFHTTFASFPDKPTVEESAALKSYIHLFQRLYPCGECAEHFAQILEKFPPQVSSRSAAAAWGCHVHNEVNKSLGKEIFDCSNIGDFYDCGCAEEEGGKGNGGELLKDREDGKPEMDEESKDKITGPRGRDFNVDLFHDGRRKFLGLSDKGLEVKGGRRKFEGLKDKGGKRRKFEGLKDKDDNPQGS
ncbi:hypothetical protein MBLNU230_g5967t1 [Neophaeotheca triangularis]